MFATAPSKIIAAVDMASNIVGAPIGAPDGVSMGLQFIDNVAFQISWDGIYGLGAAKVGAVVATNKLTIASHDFTAVASGATGDQFNVGASSAATATNLAAAINGSQTSGIKGVVTAKISSSDATIVVLTAVSPGTAGNLTLAQTGNHITLSSYTDTLSSVAAGDTITINGVVFTAESSGATGNQFNVGVDDAHTAANMAAAINASTTAGVAGVVTASAASAVVTITAVPASSVVTLSVSAHQTIASNTMVGGNKPTGTLYLEGSLDYNPQLQTGNWFVIPNVTLTNPAGDTNGYLLLVQWLAIPWLRLRYAATSGDGALTAWFNGHHIG